MLSFLNLEKPFRIIYCFLDFVVSNEPDLFPQIKYLLWKTFGI